MTTIEAKGNFTPGNTPTLAVTGGRDGIHLSFRESDDESNRCLMAWFDRDALLDAITDADATRPVRLAEPARDAA